MSDEFDEDEMFSEPSRLGEFLYRLGRPYRRLRWWWLIWAKQDVKNWLTRTLRRKPAPTRAERIEAIQKHKRALEMQLFFGPAGRPQNTDWWKA